MKYALPAYPALRNMMTDPYLEEINRGYTTQPGSSTKEYVQWQRGPVSKTSLQTMQSWVDTTLAHHNIWLVLVFHGIDNLGYEPLSHELLDTYFQYIKKHGNDLWVATFSEVAKYMRERMNTSLRTEKTGEKIVIYMQPSLDASSYNLPLTLKTYVPAAWKTVQVKQGDHRQKLQPQRDPKGNYILYRANPNEDIIEISRS
jgi:hypothetical protein